MQQITGRITTWNDDKGYGFITADNSTKKYFVHISAFGRIARRPRVGDVIGFAPVASQDGKEKAVNARIAGLSPLPLEGSATATPGARPRRRLPPADSGKRRRSLIGGGLAASLAIAAGIYAYDSFPPAWINLAGSTESVTTVRTSAGPRFRCAGKIYCSAMTSCEEAVYYLRNCPGTKMDGDHDGVPCESQWCGQ